MNEQELISIIVPIYNAENYLRKCLESLINQTYRNLQIILVDDGSTDKSRRICDVYKSNDKRIEVIHKKNEGVSVARNRGLFHVKGKYVCFVDSDDYIDSSMIEHLYQQYATADVQLSICGFYEIIDKDKIPRTKGNIEKLDIERATECLLQEDSYRGYLWNKMFLTDIIRIHDIHFESAIKVWEDVLFVAEYLKYCNKVIYDPKPLYYYCYNEASASHRGNEVESAFHVVLAQEQIEEMISKEYKKAHEILAMRILKSSMDVCRASRRQKRNKYVRKCKEIMNKYKKTGQALLTRKDKTLCAICSTSTNAFCLLYDLTHH